MGKTKASAAAAAPAPKAAKVKAPAVPGIDSVKPSHKAVQVIDHSDASNPKVVRTFSKALNSDHPQTWLEQAVAFITKCIANKHPNFTLKGVATSADEEAADEAAE